MTKKEITYYGKTYEYLASFLTTPAEDTTPAVLVVNHLQAKPPIKKLRVGMFFDGTGQNRNNDEHLPDRDISNIAKLHDLYLRGEEDGTRYERIYISGVGTITGENTKDGFDADESGIGLGIGIGSQGGHARLKDSLERLNDILVNNQYDEIDFDVFGFSRGAALARHFTNLINAWPSRIAIPRLVSNGYSFWRQFAGDPLYNLESDIVDAFPQDIRGQVRFLGLFDTVGSFYFPGNNHNFDFNLNLAGNSSERVVQLTAYHECRLNFPLSHIGTEGELPSHFTEIVRPGVHADVGGGYENPTGNGFENWEIFPVDSRGGHGSNPRTLQIAQRDAERDGLYIRVEGIDVILEKRLPTRKELAIDALHQMHVFAQESGVPLNGLDNSKVEHVIPDELNEKLDAWKGAGADLEHSSRYLAGYIHTSHREGEFESLWQRAKFRPAEGYERHEFYCDTSKAIEPEKSNVIAPA